MILAWLRSVEHDEISHLSCLGSYCTTQNTTVHRFTLDVLTQVIDDDGRKLPLKYYLLKITFVSVRKQLFWQYKGFM